MSLFSLPKELRLEIWSLVYFSQAPRLVALRTRPHNTNHSEGTLCPRYSPSPAPTVANICHEARSEAYHQARKVGHLVRLPYDRCFAVDQEIVEPVEEFFFRFEIDILYLPLEDAHLEHFDDSPDTGMLRHFRQAIECDTSLLRNIAVTQVVISGFQDGSLSNTLREFPNITRIIMMIPEGIYQYPKSERAKFVRAGQRIITMYEVDMSYQLQNDSRTGHIFMDVATLFKGNLAIVPHGMWKDW
ncbi:hypothetical protein DE146DRAFT_590578, partial [Phaeosphaeria sp. MPI-PUGE-AT-0046c]